jgi:hypothetical protein
MYAAYKEMAADQARESEAFELYLDPVEDDLTLSSDHEIIEIAV